MTSDILYHPLKFAGLALAICLSLTDIPVSNAVKETSCVRHHLELTPPRALNPGEAFVVVVRYGNLPEGYELSLLDASGKIIGSVLPEPFKEPPHSASIRLDWPIHKVLTVQARVHKKDATTLVGRGPTCEELLSIELVPREVTN